MLSAEQEPAKVSMLKLRECCISDYRSRDFFRDLRDPDSLSRRVFAFHKPETLLEWLSHYTFQNYCATCGYKLPKEILRCPDCKQKVRTKPWHRPKIIDMKRV